MREGQVLESITPLYARPFFLLAQKRNVSNARILVPVESPPGSRNRKSGESVRGDPFFVESQDSEKSDLPERDVSPPTDLTLFKVQGSCALRCAPLPPLGAAPSSLAAPYLRSDACARPWSLGAIIKFY